MKLLKELAVIAFFVGLAAVPWAIGVLIGAALLPRVL